MNKKWVYSFLGFLIFLGLVVYFVIAATSFNSQSNVRFQRTGVTNTPFGNSNWTDYNVNTIINFTINISDTGYANITNITIYGPIQYFNFTYHQNDTSIRDSSAFYCLRTENERKLMCEPKNATNTGINYPATNITGNGTHYLWFNVTMNQSGVEVNNTGNSWLNWTVVINTRALNGSNFTGTQVFSTLGIDDLAPRITQINISYVATDNSIVTYKDESGQLNNTQFTYNDTNVTVTVVITDANMEPNVTLYYNNTGKAVINLATGAKFGTTINMTRTATSGINYTYNATFPTFADGANISFVMVAFDNFSQYVLKNNSLIGGYNFSASNGGAPTITGINVTYINAEGNAITLKDELGYINQTKYWYNNTQLAINLVVTDNNLELNVTLYYNNTNKAIIGTDKGVKFGTPINMTKLYSSGSRYTYNASIPISADGTNISFFVVAYDKNANYLIKNNSLIGGYNITADGRAPDNPIITMPSQKAFYARTSITLKCNGGPDYGSGEDKTEITITRPDGTTTTKTVDTSGNAEFKDENIKDAGSYTVSCQTTDNVGLYSTDTTTDEFTVVYRSYGEPAEVGVPEKEIIFDLDFREVAEKSFEKTEGQSITFTLDGLIEHRMTWSIVSADTITLIIESDPITITLKLGETKEVDINKDGLNDMAVTLEDIEGSKARISTKKLAGAEKIAEEKEGITPPIVLPEEEVKPIWIWTTIIMVIVVLAIVGYIILKRK